MKPHSLTAEISQIHEFSDIIDVRSPSEFAADHIPGAKNFPVLNDEERAHVGTLHKNTPFEARKLGAALISANMAQFLQTVFSSHDKSWRPLIYCWRGGMRSGAATIILSQIGWKAYQLQGGYKAYRRQVISDLDTLAKSLRFIVVCGPTGSGKSRFLKALARQGMQVLDLEALAIHRGSILGLLPGDTQPSQRYFETKLWAALRKLDPSKPVFVEAESRRIGSVSLPASLYEQMHVGKCIQLDVPLHERVRFLCEDYHFYLENPDLLKIRLSGLSHLRSRQEIEYWFSLIETGDFHTLVHELLGTHYDPLYWRSMKNHYPQLDETLKLNILCLDEAGLDQAALQLMAS